MKMTIDIPDALALEARAAARRSGTNLAELVLAGLRAEVTRREGPDVVFFPFPTVTGEGLAAELSSQEVVARSYGLPS